MKNYLLTLTLLAGIIQAMAQGGSFTLQGKIKGQSSGMLKLSYPTADGGYVQDSTAIQNGKFEFKGKVADPVMAYIMGAVKSQGFDDPNMATFFIEPGKLSMALTVGDFKNLKLTGSKTHDELVVLNLRKKSQMERMRVLSVAYDKANMAYIAARKAGKSEGELEVLKEAANAEKDKMDPLREEMDKIDMEYIRTHPDSDYSAYALSWKVSSLPLAESKLLYATIRPYKAKQLWKKNCG